MSTAHTTPGNAAATPVRALYPAAMRSVGCRQAALLAAVIETAHSLAEKFLEDHPDRCRCPFCQYDRHPASLSDVGGDVAGVRWTLEVAAGILTSAMSVKIEPTGRDFGDDLRMLAAVADEIHAAYDGAEGCTDVPSIVGGAEA